MVARIKEQIWLVEVQTRKSAEAFGHIYDAYAAPIFRFVHLRIAGREESEDITSTVFLKAWQHLTAQKAQKVLNVRAFLYTVARNTIVDTYRSKGRAVVLPLDSADDVAHPHGAAEVEHSIDVSAQSQKVLGVIRELKNEYRDVVLLRYVEGYSIADIARMLQKSQANVRVTLHRAMKKIHDIFPDAPPSV